MEKDRYLGGPPWVRGGIRVSRGGIEIRGGLRKIVRGGERAGEKTPGLYCTPIFCVLEQDTLHSQSTGNVQEAMAPSRHITEHC